MSPNTSAFRVIARGKFDGLTDEQRAALRATATDITAGGAMFSAEGTFTHDPNVTVFTFRCEVPAEADDDNDRTAIERATAALDRHGLPYRDLNWAVTDMREIKVRRQGRL
jgi:hypothetical protein